MRNKNIFKSFILTLFVSFFSACYLSKKENNKPNILFIAIDDLNDWVGYLGGHPQAETQILIDL